MSNEKSKIIPESLKSNIDEIMEKQLFNANRYYAESNAEISTLMLESLTQDPISFLRNLKERWGWHNLYYENLLEPAYENLVKDSDLELSPKEVDDLIEVYSTSCLVDEATLVMSGAIKKYLDSKCQSVSVTDENLTKYDANQMLITPPVETFFAQYQIDHLYYIYLLKTKSENSYNFKKYLLNTYHANDETIFNSRFTKRFSKYLDMEQNILLENISAYRIPDDYKVKHFYFTLEHPERKAIRDIIIYDNLDEKLLACNLIGISGFLLRNKVLNYLNTSGILRNDGYIYEYDKYTITDALEKLKQERNNKMDKNIIPYKQRGDTCAIACLMMVLEYYKIMPKANWSDERHLYKKYGSRYMPGTPFSAIAYHLAKNDLETVLYHSCETIFTNEKHVLSDIDFDFSMQEYKQHLIHAESKGARVVNGIDININLLKDVLKNGNVVILAGETHGMYHAILISGYDHDKFVVCDPLYKTKQLKTEAEINDFMNTNIGKWFISVNDTRKKDRLLEQLDVFAAQAETMLKPKGDLERKYAKK